MNFLGKKIENYRTTYMQIDASKILSRLYTGGTAVMIKRTSFVRQLKHLAFI